MTRPCDWDVLALERDPTPGDAGAVAVLARDVELLAREADQAVQQLRALAQDGPVLSWIGASAEVVRHSLAGFASPLTRLADSYGVAADALGGFGRTLALAQDRADRALAQGRAARRELADLGSQLSWARGVLAVATEAVPSSREMTPPDPDQVRAAVRNAQAAGRRVQELGSARADAEARLQVLRRWALDAGELRAGAGRTAARALDDAADAAPGRSLWEGLRHAAGAVWSVVVTVATVVAVVVAVVALFVAGPLVIGVLAVAGVVLLVDALRRYARGEAPWWEVLLATAAIVPGGRLLSALGRYSGLARLGRLSARGLQTGARALARMAHSVRAGLGRGLGWAGRPVRRSGGAGARPAARLTAAQRADIDRALVRAQPPSRSSPQRWASCRTVRTGARLAGRAHRLKARESLGRKTRPGPERAAGNDSVERLLPVMSDSVRYTVLARPSDYAASPTRRSDGPRAARTSCWSDWCEHVDGARVSRAEHDLAQHEERSSDGGPDPHGGELAGQGGHPRVL